MKCNVALIIVSQLVDSRQIVKFKSWHDTETRNNFLETCCGQKLHIEPRKQDLSDFDVVLSSGTCLIDLQCTEHIKYVSKDKILDLKPLGIISRENETESASQLSFQDVIKRGTNVTDYFKLSSFYEKGITGKGISIGLLDTGISKRLLSTNVFPKLKANIDWTNENILDDLIGHGTFLASLISATGKGVFNEDTGIKGIAPDADLYVFRIFTKNQVSFTSWFLDAFNYAILRNIDVLNLSIGGPEWTDRPFVEKVEELAVNGIVLVSAIGNDGPVYGTLNNPADMNTVIGVGGLDSSKRTVSRFSSRGLTNWELERGKGAGRLKPDILTVSTGILGLSTFGKPKLMSGTSVASPVIAGCIVLVLSDIDRVKMEKNLLPIGIKQVLMKSAIRTNSLSFLSQGHGFLDLNSFYENTLKFQKSITVSPPFVDYLHDPIWIPDFYYTRIPFVMNFTVFNSHSINSRLTSAVFFPTNNVQADMLQISFKGSDCFYPFSGHFGVVFEILKPVNVTKIISGKIVLKFEFVDLEGENFKNFANAEIPLKLKITKTPAKHLRLLFDQYHSISYPISHIPIDDLSKSESQSPLDWTGDSLLSNFQGLFLHLKSQGYHVETLNTEFCEFNAENYASLLLIDPEKNFTDHEVSKIENDVKKGLNLLIFSDWYNSFVVGKLKFYDENAQKWSKPVTGGSNVPAINRLIKFSGLKFSEMTVTNSIVKNKINEEKDKFYSDFNLASGTSINIANCKGNICSWHQQKVSNLTSFYTDRKKYSPNFSQYQNVLATVEFSTENGKLFLFADSDIIDDRSENPNFKIMDVALNYVQTNTFPDNFEIKSKEPILTHTFSTNSSCFIKSNFFEDFQSMPFDYRKFQDVMIILTDKYPVVNLNANFVNRKSETVDNVLDTIDGNHDQERLVRLGNSDEFKDSRNGGYQFYKQVHLLLVITVFMIWVFRQRRYSREIHLTPKLIARAQMNVYTKL